jgi:hypothetical protein
MAADRKVPRISELNVKFCCLIGKVIVVSGRFSPKCWRNMLLPSSSSALKTEEAGSFPSQNRMGK